jgi:hypothetical protein
MVLKEKNGCTALSAPIHVLVDSGPKKPSIFQTKNVLSAATPAAAYQWYLNTKPISGAVNPELFITVNGSYTLKVFDIQGCSSISDPFITNSTVGLPSYANSIFTLQQNQPNPCYGMTKIEFSLSNPELIDLAIYSLLGERINTICSGNFGSGIHVNSVDISNLADGVYYYRLFAGGNSISKKLIILNK